MNESQTPAEGIFKINEWGNSRFYRLQCSCMDSNCFQDVWVEVEADSHQIISSIGGYATNKFWSKRYWRDLFDLIFKGRVEVELHTHMTKQQTINYAHTLLKAVKDLEEFDKKEREEFSRKNKND
jgi:hypothetical protein